MAQVVGQFPIIYLVCVLAWDKPLLQHHLFQDATPHWEEVWQTWHLSRAGAAYMLLLIQKADGKGTSLCLGLDYCSPRPNLCWGQHRTLLPCSASPHQQEWQRLRESSAIRDKGSSDPTGHLSRAGPFITPVAQVSHQEPRSLIPAWQETVHAQTHAQWHGLSHSRITPLWSEVSRAESGERTHT